MVLYRGVSPAVSKVLIPKLSEGATLQDLSFTSASEEIEVAELFSDEIHGSGGWVFRIEVDKGANVLPLDKILTGYTGSKSKGDSEFVFGRNSSFVVKSIDHEDKSVYVSHVKGSADV